MQSDLSLSNCRSMPIVPGTSSMSEYLREIQNNQPATSTSSSFSSTIAACSSISSTITFSSTLSATTPSTVCSPAPAPAPAAAAAAAAICCYKLKRPPLFASTIRYRPYVSICSSRLRTRSENNDQITSLQASGYKHQVERDGTSSTTSRSVRKLEFEEEEQQFAMVEIVKCMDLDMDKMKRARSLEDIAVAQCGESNISVVVETVETVETVEDRIGKLKVVE